MRFSFKTWLFENQRLNQNNLIAYKDPLNQEFNFRINQFAQRIVMGTEKKDDEDAETVTIRSRPGEQKSVKDMSIGGKLTGKERNLEHPEFKNWNPKLQKEIEIGGESIPITPELIEDECRKYMRENKFNTTDDFDFFGILEKIVRNKSDNDITEDEILDQMIRGHYESRTGSTGRVSTHIYKDGGWMEKESEKRAMALAGEEKTPAKGQNSVLFNYFNSGWFDIAMLGVIMSRNRGISEKRVESIWGNRLRELVPNAKRALIKKKEKQKVAKVGIGGIEANIPSRAAQDISGDPISLKINDLENSDKIYELLNTAPEDIKDIWHKAVSSRSIGELRYLAKWVLEKDDDEDFKDIQEEMDEYWGALDEKITSMNLAISGAATATGMQASAGTAGMIAMLGKVREELTKKVDGFGYSTIVTSYNDYLKKFDEESSQSPFKGKKIDDPKRLFQSMFQDAASKVFGNEHEAYKGRGSYLNVWLTRLFRNTFYREHGVEVPVSPTTPGHPHERFFRRTLSETFVGILDLTVKQLDNNTPGAYTKLVEELKKGKTHEALKARVPSL